MEAQEAGTGEEAAIDGIAALGDVVGGKFLIERVLGVGGMGVVVAARHLQLGQTVAIKFLRRSAAASSESVSRFVREARAAVGIQSAHVVRIMDVGALDDGLPYIVMEHLSGTDLGRLIEERRGLSVVDAVDYLLQAMEAIAEAHAIGIVHRDLKPSNLFLTVHPDGTPLVKVLDFGISKAMDEVSLRANLTSTAMVLGSPLYMSPEQVRSTKNVDIRTDIWALGVILYELLAGVPPFEADTVTGLCAKIVADPPVPLRSRRSGLPSGLALIVARCLDKDVTRRYQSVGSLAVALGPFASARGKLAAERVTRIGAGPRSSQWAPSAADERAAAGPEQAFGYEETVAGRPAGSGPGQRRAVIAAAIGLVMAAGVVVAGIDRYARSRSVLGRPTSRADAPLAPVATGPNRGPAILSPAPASAGAAVASGVTVAGPQASAVEGGSSVAGPAAASASVQPAAGTRRPAPQPRAESAAPRPAPARAASAKPPSEDLLLDRK